MPESTHPAATLSGSDILWKPADICERLDVLGGFVRPAPLHVDVGSGDGGFLLAMAQRHPECNFIGIERLLGRVRKTCRRAAHQGLKNVRVLRLESAYVVQRMLPAESVTMFHLLFPDPWPKRKHWPRRIFTPEFLGSIYDALAPDGEFRIKTDDEPYFRQICEVFTKDPRFEEREWNEEPDYPKTDFERGFLEKQLPIHRARLFKRPAGMAA